MRARRPREAFAHVSGIEEGESGASGIRRTSEVFREHVRWPSLKPAAVGHQAAHGLGVPVQPGPEGHLCLHQDPGTRGQAHGQGPASGSDSEDILRHRGAAVPAFRRQAVEGKARRGAAASRPLFLGVAYSPVGGRRLGTGEGRRLRFGELRGKEIINLQTGRRMGTVGESDLAVDEGTGEIQALLLPGRNGIFGGSREVEVPWSCVRRIGPEVVIVELEGPAPGWREAEARPAYRRGRRR